MSTPPRWRKSSRSNTETNCVEINHSQTGFDMRDSKATISPVLKVSVEHGQKFVSVVKSGQFDQL